MKEHLLAPGPHLAGCWGPLNRKKVTSGSDLPEQLLTFPVSFPTDFACVKLAEKIASGDHVTTGHCNHRKCKPDVKGDYFLLRGGKAD